ncbi:FAD-dependent oxidoreductase [Clostridium bowmanii]|uniref:FAD-dependent oxidoreductase n=1 Tax=Clostridium bowmanii TaxID=132925 RepID=UPI001C0D5B03|nr:FAD-dependent oxidoreductase [Clostridium bowmanii]MBU3190989.1 FAD-dependent oxidoreductase [Clostridium bowmanii]MCA1075392.1 FAD-dependent oxidoreductase [Clostridium bowmanii]
MKVIIIGGGWSGCAAAITAKKAGAQVELYERTDLLLGLGNVGGIMRNNGRYTAAEELINLGAKELFLITDTNSKHKNLYFPHHKHCCLYDVGKIEPEVTKTLLNMGVKVHLKSRIVNVEKEEDSIKSIKLYNGSYVVGDVFIDCTGSTGGMANCLKYGNGCVMCILRCPTFGSRVSISEKAGIKDILSEKDDGSIGAFSGSCEIPKDCLADEIIAELDKKGVVILKTPPEDVNSSKLNLKVCQQYNYREFAENVILLDTGHIKLMTPFYPLDKLRKIKGLERVRFMDPYSGGIGNSIRYLAAAPRGNDMKVTGIKNLFCAGEKSGFFVGHTEAICTGSLAGHNAVRFLLNVEPLVLPNTLCTGDIISYSNYLLSTEGGKKVKLSFSGSEYLDRMEQLGLYSTDNEEIKNRVKNSGLENIFDKQLI